MEQKDISAPKINIGEIGPFYRYEIHSFKELAESVNSMSTGILVLTKREEQTNGSFDHQVCYIETIENLPTVQAMEEEIFKLGVNCLAVMHCSSQGETQRVENQCLSFWHPILNNQ